MIKTKSFQVFPLVLAANESRQVLYIGTYFKILSATGAVDVTIEGQGTLPDLTSGKGLKDTPFTRLVLTDKTGAANTIYLMCATAEYVDQTYSGTVALDAATLAALESVDLNAATLSSLKNPQQSTGNFASNASLAAATAQAVFLPAANVAGAIILSAGYQMVLGGSLIPAGALIAKNAAPASNTDGEVLMVAAYTNLSGTTVYEAAQLPREQYIPAGLGLYFITSNGAAVGYPRHCRYILL